MSEATIPVGADTGLAKSRGVRSDAMWLAENWTTVAAVHSKNHHPIQIRQECRDAGYEWAFDQREGGLWV
jgi:hypothetical protein